MSALTLAERQMVAENVGLIGWTVNRHRHLGVGLYSERDAWQDGYFGLVRAVQLYDPAKGAFSTYAARWIRTAIERGRGTFEGVDFRRSWDHGLPIVTALSLDAETAAGAPPLSEVLVADDDPEAAALSLVDATDAGRALLAACSDDLDRSLVAFIASHDGGPQRQGLLELAARFGRTENTMRVRQAQLLARARTALTEQGMAA